MLGLPLRTSQVFNPLLCGDHASSIHSTEVPLTFAPSVVSSHGNASNLPPSPSQAYRLRKSAPSAVPFALFPAFAAQKPETLDTKGQSARTDGKYSVKTIDGGLVFNTKARVSVFCNADGSPTSMGPSSSQPKENPESSSQRSTMPCLRQRWARGYSNVSLTHGYQATNAPGISSTP
jgi:hypothetical protein